MKPFYFMRHTPRHIRETKTGGQFNGYIAFDLNDKEYVTYKDDFFERDMYNWNFTEEATFIEERTLRDMGAIFPCCAIPEEATANKLLIVGFDTCHIWDTFEENDYDGVLKRLRVWYNEAVEMLEQARADAAFEERLNDLGRMDEE